MGWFVKKNCKSPSHFLIKMGTQDIFVSDYFRRESMTIVTTAYTWWWSIDLREDWIVSYCYILLLDIFWDVPSTFFFRMLRRRVTETVQKLFIFDMLTWFGFSWSNDFLGDHHLWIHRCACDRSLVAGVLPLWFLRSLNLSNAAWGSSEDRIMWLGWMRNEWSAIYTYNYIFMYVV